MRKEITPIVILLVIIVATVLRIYSLDNGLWYDEIVTYVNYIKFPFGHIITTYNDQNNHLLYTILARFSIGIFGESAWSVRVPAVIFGVASIWAIFQLGRLVSNTREGLLSALLLTFSYHHIWFSQNARGYTGLLFWTIFSSWLLLKGTYENNSKTLILYAVTAALGMYTHMTMIVVIIGQVIMYWVVAWSPRNKFKRGKWKGFFCAFVLGGLFTIFLYSPVLLQIFKVYEGTENSVLKWKDPIWALFELMRGLQISFSGSILGLTGVALFIVGLLSYIRSRVEIVILFAIPVLLLATVIISEGFTLFPRLFFFSIGFGALIVVRGVMISGGTIARMLRFDSTAATRAGTALCAGMICVSMISVPSVYAPKQDFRGALKFVEKSRKISDAVVTVGMPATLPYKRFFKVDWQGVETLDDLYKVRSHAERTWLLYTMPVHFESAYPEIFRSIRTDFTVVREFHGSLGDGTIYVCMADGHPSKVP